MSTLDPHSISFGSRLKLARTQKGLTQGQLAALCGQKGNSWVARLESDKPGQDGRASAARTLAVEHLIRLAEVLEVSISWLATGLEDTTYTADKTWVAIGLGGPDIPLEAFRKTGLLLEAGLVAIWPGSWINEDDLPISNAIVLCRGAMEPMNPRFAYASVSAGSDPSMDRYRYLPRAANWRDKSVVAGAAAGRLVVGLIPGPGQRIKPKSSQVPHS